MNTEISATSEHPFNPRISHNSITTNRRKNKKKEKEREREIEESIRNNSVTQAWKMFPSQIVDHFSQITVDSHRYSAYFERKAGRRRFERSGEEREREEGSFTSHSAKII